MLLLMRRIGEVVRINEKITLEVKEIHEDCVSFIVKGMSVREDESNPIKEEKKVVT